MLAVEKIDNENLLYEMSRHEVSPHRIAVLLGIEDHVVVSRISGDTEWIYKDAVLVRDTFFPECSLDYLFFSEKNKR